MRLALVLPCVYHGAWNLGSEGGQWWAAESGLPPTLRFVVGSSELLAALGLTLGLLVRPAALGLLLLFLGALPEHWAHGYSFKKAGIEPVLTYILLTLALLIRPREIPSTPGVSR